MKVVVYSIVPSPYQRDFFSEFSKYVELQVYYLELESPDSPWPKKELANYESILPGSYLSLRGMRFHLNWKIPNPIGADAVILNGYMGIIFQWMLRFKFKRCKFFFWGERLSQQPAGLKGRLQRWLSDALGNCKGIAAIGSRAEKEYRERFPGLKVSNIPYHCDLTAFQKLPIRKAEGTIHFLFCGQMIYRKGVDTLLRAFELLATRDVQLHLVGRQAELPQMLSRISSEAKSKIAYHGFQAPEKLAEYFSLAHVFVLPSRYDGWGVVVNQAIGAGLPVIVSDQVGAADLITKGKNGFVFPAGDEISLFHLLKYFTEYPYQVEVMSEHSREESFSLQPEQAVVKWQELIKG